MCTLLGEKSQGWHHCLDQTPGKIGLPLYFPEKHWPEQLLQVWWRPDLWVRFCRVGGEQWDSKWICWVGNLDMQKWVLHEFWNMVVAQPVFYLFMLCLVWFLTQSQAPGPQLIYLLSTQLFLKVKLLETSSSSQCALLCQNPVLHSISDMNGGCSYTPGATIINMSLCMSDCQPTLEMKECLKSRTSWERFHSFQSSRGGENWK